MHFTIYDVFYSQYGDTFDHIYSLYSCNKDIIMKMAAIPTETCW